jgi:proteasome lid subunit RPN8/RPN11
LYDGMVAHALAERPNECCGLLAGREGEFLRRYPLVNELSSPREYQSEPHSLLAAFRAMREERLDLLGIYHAHPTSPPVPSRTDLERNFYGPEVVHFIVSLSGPEPVLRGWHLEEGAYYEADWRVE